MNFLELDHFQFTRLFAVSLSGRGTFVNRHYVNFNESKKEIRQYLIKNQKLSEVF